MTQEEINQAMNAETIVSIDLGGTKILGALINRSAQIITRLQHPSPKGNDAVRDAIVEMAAQLTASAQKLGFPLHGAAICAPGFIDTRSGTMVDADNLQVKNLPLARALEERFHLPTRLYHDAQSSTLGEAVFGAGRGQRDFIYLNIGTGVSVGLYLDGKVYQGATGKAGELGNHALRLAGPEKPCGWEERLEQLASGPALVRRAVRQFERLPGSLIFELAGCDPDRVTTQIIQAAACQQDTLAVQLLEETADYLGFAIGGLQDVLDPECIILGGGIAKLGDLILNPLKRSVERYAIVAVPILLSTLGGDSGVIGAAAAFFEQGE